MTVSRRSVLSIVTGGVFLLNLGCFSLLALHSFQHNAKDLFHGFDGGLEATLIALQSRFAPNMLGFASNFLQGLGNVWFPLNASFVPEYVLSLNGPGTIPDFVYAY